LPAKRLRFAGETAFGRRPAVDVSHGSDDRVLLLRRADYHALVVEQRRG
jgi:hypothetical protein